MCCVCVCVCLYSVARMSGGREAKPLDISVVIEPTAGSHDSSERSPISLLRSPCRSLDLCLCCVVSCVCVLSVCVGVFGREKNEYSCIHSYLLCLHVNAFTCMTAFMHTYLLLYLDVYLHPCLVLYVNYLFFLPNSFVIYSRI